MSKLCSVPLIPPAPIPAAPPGAGCPAAVRTTPTDIQQERRAAVVTLKAGLAFLLAYFGLFMVIVLSAIANEAPGKHPGLWHYIHAAPKWVTPGATCEINLDTLQQWTIADHAVRELVDTTGACDEVEIR
jgi:hypothetical protein